ncbi:MAG: helix-turn-helix domain-containing protein [Neisseria sp.]|nr:helix-turn-helix domain-containing protein [Neisseria sp.]
MVNESRKIQAVEKAMYVLERLAAAGGKARLVDLEQETGIHKATLHGLLNTLVALGYIERENRAYVLGLRFREIARLVRDEDELLLQQYQILLQKIHDYCGEDVYFAVPCGTREYRYLAVLGDSEHFDGISPRGRREGLTTSAMGKIFVANLPAMARSLRRANKMPSALNRELPQIVAQGYALDLGEAQSDLHAFAVPITVKGITIAGVSVAGSAQNLPETRLREWAEQVKTWCVLD